MRPLIAANWKMHGDMSWVEKLRDFDRILPPSKRTEIEVLICPPAVFIAPMFKTAGGTSIKLGAQNCHAEETGAHTGEISAHMLKDAGARYVIVGHSERRAGGETSAGVKAKAKAATAIKLKPIICVGESLAQREAGKANATVKRQLSRSLPEGDKYVVAYEPIWAIGTGKTATPDDIESMHAHIREIVGDKVRILYGGSVKPANASDILHTPNVNGALIGGASLEMDSLAAIAKAAM